MWGMHDVTYAHGGDNWTWWLEHGLDGIAGGLIGGAITGLAVWATLKHERNLAETASKEEDAASLRQDVAKFHRVAARLLFRRPTRATSPRWPKWRADLFSELVLLEARARLREPEFSSRLRRISDRLDRTPKLPSGDVDTTLLMKVAVASLVIATRFLGGEDTEFPVAKLDADFEAAARGGGTGADISDTTLDSEDPEVPHQ